MDNLASGYSRDTIWKKVGGSSSTKKLDSYGSINTAGAINCWTFLHILGLAFLAILVIFLATKASESTDILNVNMTQPLTLKELAANNTNVWSTSSAAPGFSFPIVMIGGVIHTIWLLWVRRAFSAPKVTVFLSAAHGPFMSGIYFIAQGSFLLCLAYDQRGGALGLECVALLASSLPWLTSALSRHAATRSTDVNGGAGFQWLYFINENLYELYMAAATIGLFWVGFNLSASIGGPLVNLHTQDISGVAIFCTVFVIVPYGVTYWNASFMYASFMSVLFLFIGFHDVGIFPMSSIGAFAVSFANFGIACLGGFWLSDSLPETKRNGWSS